MQRIAARLVALAALTSLPFGASADALVGSWNLMHMGWANEKAYGAVAYTANHFDLLAVQELMDPSALGRLESELEALTNEEWSAIASEDLGRSSYREHYGFLWRESEVDYLGGAAVFLDRGDVFAREPFSAIFRDSETGTEFAAASVHILYGDSISDRLPEIDALADYWNWLGEAYPGTPRLLMGDYNLSPEHEGWAALRQLGASPAITRGATTLSSTDGRYANLYDNLWSEAGRLPITGKGILRFPELLGINHEEARDRVSDHAPVFVALNGATMENTMADYSGSRHTGASGSHCIDLNTAGLEQLDALPHIGPARAENIVDGRPWPSVDSLTRIRGLGSGRVGDIQDSGLLCQ